jgi:hypothetical protein
MLRRLVFLAALLLGLPAWGQSGLRPPERPEPGLDPSFARGWLAPQYDAFGFAAYQWRDAYGFAPSPRMRWSYDIGARASFSMSLANARESDFEPRPYSLFGRYSLNPDWALSAESVSRDPSGLLRMQDFRIGVQRRF